MIGKHFSVSRELFSLLALTAALFFWGSPVAGEPISVYQMGTFKPGSQVMLFGDRVNMRAQPDTKAPVVKNLSIGTPLMIEGDPNGTFQNNGFESGWYKASVMNSKEPAEGFVWGGLLSLCSTHWNEDGRFLGLSLGIVKGNPNDFAGEARVLEFGQIVATTSFSWICTKMGDEKSYGYNVSIEEIPWKGAPVFKKVFQIECTYDACGYARGKQMFFWDGKHLFSGPQAIGVSEAGVFHVSSGFVLPGEEKVKPDEILVRTVESQEDPKSAKKREVLFVWNGSAWEEKGTVETPIPYEDAD